MQIIGTEEKLLEQIHVNRKILNQSASKYGLTDSKVVELSEKLDGLINEIQMRRRYLD